MSRTSVSRPYRNLALALVVGTGSGLVCLGVGWRLIMRGIVLMAGQSPSYWWPATLGIVATGAAVGTISALLFLGARWIPGATGTRAGVWFGLILYALLFWQMPDRVRRELEAYPQFLWHSVGLFGITFLAHGWILGRFLPAPARADAPRAAGPAGPCPDTQPLAIPMKWGAVRDA